MQLRERFALDVRRNRWVDDIAQDAIVVRQELLQGLLACCRCVQRDGAQSV